MDFFIFELKKYLSFGDYSPLILASKLLSQVFRPIRAKFIVEEFNLNPISPKKLSQVCVIFANNLENEIDPNTSDFDPKRTETMNAWPSNWRKYIIDFEENKTTPLWKLITPQEDVAWRVKERDEYPLVCLSARIEPLFRFLVNDSRTDTSALDDEAFQLACIFGYYDIAETLLELGAKPSRFTNFALRTSCKKGYKEIAKMILKHPDFDFDEHNENELMIYEFGEWSGYRWRGLFIWLIQNGQFEIVDQFWESKHKIFSEKQLIEIPFDNQTLSNYVSSHFTISECVCFLLDRLGNNALKEAFKKCLSVTYATANLLQKLINEYGADPGDSELQFHCLSYFLDELRTTTKGHATKIDIHKLVVLLKDERFNFTKLRDYFVCLAATRADLFELVLEIPRVRSFVSDSEFIESCFLYGFADFNSCSKLLKLISIINPFERTGNTFILAVAKSNPELLKILIDDSRIEKYLDLTCKKKIMEILYDQRIYFAPIITTSFIENMKKDLGLN